MDQLSSLYVRMASGSHSQLHNPISVIGFVDQMQSRMEKSSAPRKNYLIDSSTPHSDTVIAESSALKPSVGWVTLQVTEGIRRGIHEWGIKIEHHGESNDGSGLMLGIVPKNFTKYDTFISQGGGWCLSRAGKFYGHWRRTDTGGGVLTFGTGDRIVLTLDYDAAVMTVRVGDKMIVGELSGLTMEVFPAISLHYRHQHVRFDHHAVRETAEKHLPWLQRQAFPFAPAFLPLRFADVQRLPLNSYLFSNLFQHTSPEWRGVTGVEGAPIADTAGGGDAGHPSISVLGAADKNNSVTTLSSSSVALAAARQAEQRAMRLYTSSEAAAARLTVLSRAFGAVRRYVAVVPGKSRFLAPHVTAEYLRQRLYSAAHEPTLGSGGGTALTISGGHSGSGASVFRLAESAGYDATLNCGAVIVVHLFIHAVSSGKEVATPLVQSFRDYLLSLPIFSLVECDGCATSGGARGTPFGGSSSSGGGGARSALAPDTVQLAVDHIVRQVDSAINAAEVTPATAEQSLNSGGDRPAVTPLTSALLEVALVLALQRGLVSEVLRVSRYLLRVPAGVFSPPLVQWLNRHAAGLTPQPAMPDVGRALKCACEDPSAFIVTPVNPVTTVLSVAYGIGTTLFVHTADGLAKYGPSVTTSYVLVVETRQPTAYCLGAASSSLAVTHTRVLLLTDRMAPAEVALVVYGLQLDTHQVLRWADMHSSWPCMLNSHPQLVSTTEDRVLVVYEDHRQQAPPARTLDGAAAAAGTLASAAATGGVARSRAGCSLSTAAATATSAEWTVMMHCYIAATASSLAAAPLWTRALHPAPAAAGLCLSHCLALRKPSLVDLGCPEDHLTVAGGQVTVELWVQFLDKEDAATLYQHGDRSTNGEVFLELTKSEGTYCIRGGYRHEMRGLCVVSAPLPPTAETRPFHIGLVFNGRWRLLFDGEEVAGNRQGPHVSLDSPKQRWTVGTNCTCLLTGLRVWRLGRTTREISRDYRRSLVGDEPGLVVQLFFNEKSGNVVFNYVHSVKACHAVCIGAVTRKPCDAHPWRSYGSGALGGNSTAAASASVASTGRAAAETALAAVSTPDVTPVCARLHEWRDLAISTCCAIRHALIVRTPISNDGPYALREGGHVLMFFDLTTGVAHHSLFFLTSRSPVRHMMRADPQGRLWELFEVDVGLVKGEQEASYLLSLLGNTGAAPQRPRDRVLAVAPLPLVEDEEALDHLGTLANKGEDEEGDGTEEVVSRDSSGSTTTSESHPVSTAHSTAELQGSGEAAASQTTQILSRMPSFAALVSQPSSVVTYGAVALWLLKLLALHAEAEPGVDQTLFSPLADDVGSRCVTEVRHILGEHFRVVKSSNARRAVALKSSVSWVVVAAALRVLLRLVRCARAFGLHPTPLGLTVVREGTEHDGEAAADGSKSSPAHISKATMTLLLRELHASSTRRRTSASVMQSRLLLTGPHTSGSGDDDDSCATDSFTLLGLLGDIINEEGLTLSPDVVALARTTTIEGVELFLPDVRHRAHLLRDLLRATSCTSTSPRVSPAAGDAAAASSPSATTEERVPAMEVLLDAVAQSFTTVLAAAPLLGVEDDGGKLGNSAAVTELCDTLRTLLEESSAQWRFLWTAKTAMWSIRKFSAFAASLSEAIASLQLLLLSACQGSRWEAALTLMHASGGGRGANHVADPGGISDRSGQGDSSHGGNGMPLNGIAESAVDGVNGGGTGVGGPDSVAAVALDLQRLCFSQAAAYHPCVRAYYSALFDSTELCLNLCVQQPQQSSAGGISKTAERGDADSGEPLSAILSSLLPTFVNAPLHTALSAIPLVLAAEDAEWFLKHLEHLLELCETLLERVELPTSPNSGTDLFTSSSKASGAVLPGSGASAAARRLLCSLREAFFYASVWVAAFLFNSTAVSSANVRSDAVRRRLGLMSVTTTPITQRQTAQLTGHATSVAAAASAATGAAPASSAADDAASAAVDEELARLWEHPLLEGGLRTSTVTTAAAATPTATKTPAATVPRHRAQFVSQLIKNTAYWTAKQSMLDPLTSKSHPAVGPLITAMAAAALHLSATPLQHLPPTRVEELMCTIMRKLSRPIRTELLSRRGEGKDHSSGGLPPPPSPRSLGRPESLGQTVAELQRRCEVLLQARSCTELWGAEDALFCIPTACTPAAATAVGTSAMGTPPSSSAPSVSAALHSAWSSYRLRRMRFHAHVASHPSWTLHEATQLVTSVVLSRQVTAELLRTSLQQREALAALRRSGIEHIFRLVQRAPHSAESAAQLLSAQGRGAHTHYEAGISGCGSAHVDPMRRVLYDLLRWSMEEMPTQLGASGGATRSGGSLPLSTTSSAAVLCSLLDRSWRPRDFAFFVQLRVVPTMMETYGTLFAAAKRAHDEEAVASMSSTRSSSDAFGRQRHSTVAATATTSSSNAVLADNGATATHLCVRSMGLRHVNLAEQQHRDKVITAQQARRTSKSALMTALTLNGPGSVGSSGGAPPSPPGLMSGSNGDITLQHTAVEAMQARVWHCFKSLALQATAMLTPEHIMTLSRVEQTSVMAFLADMLGAMEAELRLCQDVLSRAVKDTPVLLAQAGDAAVLEPLVTVQDQVDLILSFLSLVGGTLCSASVSVRVSAPIGHIIAGGASNEQRPSGDDGTALFLSCTLSTVCATIAETLLELVFLDLYHVRAVSADATVGCVVRDAAACARIAALLLCRCQPSAVRGIAVAPSAWREMYDSPVFAKVLSPTSSPLNGGHPCMQTWLDLSVYALATTGMSRTTQHLLLGFHRLLLQPAWAVELRAFASSYQGTVQDYAASVLSSCSGGSEAAGVENGAASKRSNNLSTGTASQGRELHLVQLYVWSAALGGQLLVPPTSPGASVAFLNDKDGYQATPAYVVDVETVASSSVAPGGTPNMAGASPSALPGRPIRGSSHFVLQTATTEGEKVRGVVVAPTDAAGLSGNREEVQLSPNQIFLPAWENGIVAPSYTGLVEDFLAPPLRHCVPLLGKKLDAAAAFTGLELTYFISVLHLTAGVARARPDLGRQLIECGAMRPIRQCALQNMVRLPFPLKALREFGALVAVRAAEAAADRIYASVDKVDNATSLVSSVAGATTTSPAGTSSLAAALATASAADISRASGGSRSPFGSPSSTQHHPFAGMSDALLESLRGVSPGPSVGYPATFLSGFPQSSATAASSSGFLRDSNEYGLSRLARSLGVFGGASQQATRTIGVSVTSILSSGSGLSSTSARIPPRTEVGNGSPMFLSFPMWPAHDVPTHGTARSGAAWLPYTPAAVEITPSRTGVHFPVWEDGFAIELAVLLSDGDMYPAMGDALSVPCSRPRLELDAATGATALGFPLVTLYTPAGGGNSRAETAATPSSASLFPFLKLSVQEDSLHVVVTLPPSTGGAVDGTGGLHCSARRALRREDWYRCMHVSVMCNAQSLALSRNGEVTSVEWGGAAGVGRHAEALLRQEGAITKVVIGRAATEMSPAALPAPPREVDGPMALIGGLRLWGTSVLRTSLRVVAELVARDRALQSIGLQENMCYLDLKEGTGAVVESADNHKQFRGVLSGDVRWAAEPLPLGFYPSIELNSGNVRDGVVAPLASSTHVPRVAMATFVDSLSPLYYERFGGDVLWSLLTLAARYATLTALEVGVSPAYTLHYLADTPSVSTVAALSHVGFDPRQVLDPTQKVPYQLLRLFQLQDSGYLPNAHERLIHAVVQRLVAVLAAAGPEDKTDQSSVAARATNDPRSTAARAASPLCQLVADTSHVLRQLRRDDGEVFVIEVPPLSPAASASAPITQPVVLPLSLTNGGTGVLTFDAKYRNMEQATVYKDMELKNVLAKYPDGQGGWPVCTLTATETPWAYLRSVPTSTAHRLAVDSKAYSPGSTPSSSIVTVTTKSLKSAVLHAIVKALCDALRNLAATATGAGNQGNRRDNTSTGSTIAERAAACLFDARVVVSLIQQSSARSSDDDCVHFVHILTTVMQLWRDMPQVQPYDQVPLAMAMSHLNTPLCSIIQHVNSDSDLGSLLSLSTGTYSSYVQSLLGLLVSAVRADCAWAGRSYVEQLQGRWRRLWGMWQRAVVYRPSKLADAKGKKPKGPASGDNTNKGGSAALPKDDRREGVTEAAAITTSSTFRALFLPPSSSSSSCYQPQEAMPSVEMPQADSLDTSVAIAGSLSTRHAATEVTELERNYGGYVDGEDPLDSVRGPGCVTAGCGGESSALPLVVELVAMQVAATEPEDMPPSSTFSLTGHRGRQSQQHPRGWYPHGVSRKGNGLWVVRATDMGKENEEAQNPFSARDGAARSVTTVRSSVGVTIGVFYWEVYVANISRAEHPTTVPGGGAKLVSNIVVGVATERCVLTHCSATGSGTHAEGRDGFLGNDGESWAFDGGRALRFCRGYAVESSPRTRWKMDDVIGFVLDLRQNKLSCLHNGRLVSEFSDTFLSDEQRAARVAVFPVIMCTGEASCEVNFGATGFASTPPPGCLPVDLSIYINEEACRVWKVILANEVSAPLTTATTASAARVVQPARLLSSPVIALVGQHLTRFTQGRQGPLDVVLLSPDTNAKFVTSRECKTEDAASLLFGSVAVTSGRWYFEVVLPTEPTFSVGWYARKSLEEQGGGSRGGAGLAELIGVGAGGAANNRDAASVSPTSPTRAQLGSDGASWVFDAGRMIARHNKHQISLSRRAWKCGDVVGCLLDCEAGTVSFSVNGEFLKAAHGNDATGGDGRGGGNAAVLGGTRGNSESFEATATTSSAVPWFADSASAFPTQDVAATALFSDVCMSETHGLVPVILLEPKSSLMCLWNEEELLFPPMESGAFRALGGAGTVHEALMEMIVVTDPGTTDHFPMQPPHGRVDVGRNPNKGKTLSKPLDAVALQKLLYYASKVQELHPNSLRSYTMPSLYSVHDTAESHDRQNASVSRPRDIDANAITPRRAVSQKPQQRDLCTVSGLDAATLQPHLMGLLLFGHLVTLLYPFAHAAALPVSVENAPLGSSWVFSELQETLRACQRYAPPWAPLRVLQWSLESSNSGGDAVRLSVNRRKALTVVRDCTASAARRLRDSLFGQVYQLLASKPPAFFITSKKLWSVSFYGEGADDVGGPYRECLTQMCAELMSTSLDLFLPSANMTSELGEVRDSYVVNPLCAPPLEPHMYRFLGRLMGGCLRGGEPLSLYLPSALWKYLVGEAADDADIARVDVATLNALDYAEQLAGFLPLRETFGGSGDGDDTLRNEELAELYPRGFSLLNDAGVVEELVPNGAQILVTVASVGLYTRLVRKHKLYCTAAAQRRALQQGFHEVVPLCSVSGLKWYELEELVCGQCDYDPDALLDAARYEGLSPTDTRVRFLRCALHGFTRHQRALFMRFVSGRERLPPGMHLKIMPDDTPRVAPIPPLTPERAAPSVQSASPNRPQRVATSMSNGATTAMMTPQPPPSSEQRCSTSFVRHNTLAQSRTSSNVGSTTVPPSPPQLGFTPPPAHPVSRVMPPPALQPGQLLPLSGSSNGAESHTPASPHSSHGTQEGYQQLESKSGDRPVEGGVDPSLCDDTRLPQASTCFYWLRLPCYSSASVMAQKLLFAIEQCVDIDADFRVHDTDVAQQEVGPSLVRVSSDEDDLFEDFSHLR
ncbi:putative SPRY domain/HECT-domain (ubiquitin-transferase) [Leishmania shawi]|uniref:SPRY domain/HECT-domain (Ubiquitin-transferase) n=1 Tax=Leishmania shawi TaxID=5680 RepID=A0AAW3C251_9TRYP